MAPRIGAPLGDGERAQERTGDRGEEHVGDRPRPLGDDDVPVPHDVPVPRETAATPAGLERRVLESIREGLLVTDAEWRLTYLNALAERVTGARRQTALGRRLWDVFPSLVGTPVERAVRRTLETGEPQALRATPVARAPGGEPTALFDARCYPVVAAEDDDGGRTAGVLLLFTEVSARERQTRELLQRSAENERLRRLAREMAAGADSSELLLTLCDAAVELCRADGATVAQIGHAHGAFVASVGHPADVLGREFPLAGTLTGRLLADFRADGRTTLLAVTGEQAHDAAYCGQLLGDRTVGSILLAPLAAHGELLGVLAVSRAEEEAPFAPSDAERLRVVADHASLALHKARLVEEAQAASRTKTGFIATVSHELRTPLTALTGYGELLADEILGPLSSEQHDIVERMRGVTHQLTGMIEEILTFSSLEAGRELVRPVPVDVAEIVQAVQAVIEPLAEAKGLALHLAVPPAPPPLVTDPDKVRQILVNLLGNAVKFTERGEVGLDVGLAAEGREVRFTVSDTGVGIAREDLGRLFRPFSQLDTGLTRRYGGTGLGLNISQRLAQLLDGRIEVASTPAVGSVFTLALPVPAPIA